jgi:hypothetical protein
MEFTEYERAIISEALEARARTHSGRAGYATKRGNKMRGWGYPTDAREYDADRDQELIKAEILRDLAKRFEEVV